MSDRQAKTRRVIASVDYVKHTASGAGNVHRSITKKIDLTNDVFRLSLPEIKALRDGGKKAMALAEPHVDGTVVDIQITGQITYCIGVSRLSAITDDDYWAARRFFGLVRLRTRPERTEHANP